MRRLFLFLILTVLVAPSVSAQSATARDLILKEVEPDYGDDASQPMITVPIVIDFLISPDGTPFSVASQDGGLEDRVVRALAQYRFAKSKTGMGFTIGIPLKRTIASFDVGERSYTPAPRSAVEAAEKIDASALAKFERELPKRDSVPRRAALLVHAATHSGDDVNKVRVRQLDWLIQNEPKASILKSSVALVHKAEDPAGYEVIRQLWLAKVKQNPVDRDVMESATNFLRLASPEDAVAVLQPYAGRMLHAMIWLGELYGLHAIGAVTVDSLDGKVVDAAPSLPSSGFAPVARAALSQQTELPLLLAAFGTMNDAARSLNLNGRLPQGFEAFCASILGKIKAIKSNFDRTCEARSPGFLQISGDVMKGKLTKQVRPSYPTIARDSRVQGTVVLDAVIGKDGKMQSVKLLKGPLVLYEESRDAVLKWEYKPYEIGGQPVEVMTEIEVNYSLR